MFIHETHLPQLLKPEHFTSQEFFDREIETLFEPGWHCIGAFCDAPKDGDFFTYEFLGRPVITWRTEGEYHTFLNVCTHRFSLLQNKPCGHIGNRMKCMYHAWEYDKHGDTQKIPDAESFRPMVKGELGLTKFRTETFGQLIFITLNEDAPPLREFLGEDLYEKIDPWFSTSTRRHCLSFDFVHECNWKVVIENVLERYHLDAIQAETFGMSPQKERCAHEFHEKWNMFTDDYSKHNVTMGEKYLSRLVHVEPDYMWKHIQKYPNMLYAEMALFNFAHTLIPISKDKCRAVWRIFTNVGEDMGVRANIVEWVLKKWGKRFWTKLNNEDYVVYPSIHDGICSPMRPGKGLVSIREERIFPFQQYVLQNTSDSPEEYHDENLACSEHVQTSSEKKKSKANQSFIHSTK